MESCCERSIELQIVYLRWFTTQGELYLQVTCLNCRPLTANIPEAHCILVNHHNSKTTFIWQYPRPLERPAPSVSVIQVGVWDLPELRETSWWSWSTRLYNAWSHPPGSSSQLLTDYCGKMEEKVREMCGQQTLCFTNHSALTPTLRSHSALPHSCSSFPVCFCRDCTW